MTGYTGMFTDAGKGYHYPKYDIEFVDNFTKVHGRHTFKFGINETGYKNYTRQGGEALTGVTITPLGGFTFSGQWSGNRGWPGQPSSQGNAFADFLLGLPATTNFAGPLTNYQITTRDWEFYGQDTFQVTSEADFELWPALCLPAALERAGQSRNLPRSQEQQARDSAGLGHVYAAAARRARSARRLSVRDDPAGGLADLVFDSGQE